MNILSRRRARLSPAEIKASEDSARQQTALAVSIATRQAEAKVQADVMEALNRVIQN